MNITAFNILIMIKGNYTIKEVSYKIAMDIVVENHYLHRKAPCSKAFGLFDLEDRIKGVVCYGVSCSSTLLRGVCGDSEKQNIYELTRLWVCDSVPKNGETFLIGNTIKKLDKEIIISFADTSQGHNGVIYQAANFIYTGLSAKFKDPKVKGLEHQHHATYAHGMNMQDIRDKYGADNVYYVDRPRRHRYVYFNCKHGRRKELLSKMTYKILPYPK